MYEYALLETRCDSSSPRPEKEKRFKEGIRTSKMTRIYEFGGLGRSDQKRTEASHTILYDRFQYVVKCTNETHCGYAKRTIWIEKVIDKITGNPVSYRDMHEDEAFDFHLRNMMKDSELNYIMSAAERYFVQHNNISG